jgi:hypothetical protein
VSEEKRTRAEIEASWAPIFEERQKNRRSSKIGAYMDAYMDAWYQRELDQAIDRLPKWDGE